MALPRVRTRLTSSAPAQNIQDLSAIAHVVGPASDGPIGVPTQINNLDDLAVFKFGPGPEQVGDLLSVAGAPVFFTRSETTTDGAVQGDLMKAFGGDAEAENVYGAIILPGADHDGDLLFRSLQPGVTLTLAVGGAIAWARNGLNLTLTVVNTSTATQVVAAALGAAAGYVAQPALSGDATGASVCGQVLAQTAFDRGTIAYTAKGAGCYRVPGADANGGVIYLTDRTGVSVQQVLSGNNTPLTAGRVGSKLVVNLETDGAGVVLSTADDVVELLTDHEDALYLGIVATATGTGAGLAAAIAETDLAPVKIAHVISGLSTALDTTLLASTVTVTEATNADGNATSTATLILADLVADAACMVVLGAALLGSGAGIGGPQSAMELNFGTSTGTATLTGTPNDSYRVQAKIVRGGTVGTQPYPTMIWAVDYLAGTSLTPSWSGVTLIPATGIVELKDGSLDTGLTITFTGVLVADDIFVADTTPPRSGSTDLLAGIDAAIAETRFAWGFLTGPDSVTKAIASLIDSRVQAAFDSGLRQVRAQFGVRDRGEGVPGENVTQYQATIEADFLGFVSARGRVAQSAYAILHISPYTLRQYRRPTVWASATRKASIPVHENLGKVGSGPLRNVLFIFDDEQKTPGLFDARFITPITYPQRPGYYYLTGAPTMADAAAPADAGYTLCERVCIANQIARIAAAVSLQYLNDSLPGTAAANPAAGIVAGAIDTTVKGDIESKIGRAIETFLFARKTDQKSSATPLPPGGKYCTIRQDNNFLNDRTLYEDIQWIPLGLAQTIDITVTTKIPG